MAGEPRIVYDDGIYTATIGAIGEVSSAMQLGKDAVERAVTILNSVSSAGGSLSSDIGGTVLETVNRGVGNIDGALSEIKSIMQRLGFAQQVMRGTSGRGHGGGGISIDSPGIDWDGVLENGLEVGKKIWDFVGDIGDKIGSLEDILGVEFIPEDIKMIFDVQAKIDNYAENINDIMDAWNNGDMNGLVENILDVGGDIVSEFVQDPLTKIVLGNVGDMAHAYTYADSVIVGSNNQLIDSYHSGDAGLGETIGGVFGGSLGGSVVSTVDALTNTVGIDIPDSWTDAAVEFGTTVGKVGGEIIEGGVDFVCDVGGALYDFGSDCVSGFVSWICG